MQMAAVLVDLTKFRTAPGPSSTRPPRRTRFARRCSRASSRAPTSSGWTRCPRSGRSGRRSTNSSGGARSRGARSRRSCSTWRRSATRGRRRSASSRCTCPERECGQDTSTVPIGLAGATCPHCGERLMVGDALRAHETFTEHGSNQEACRGCCRSPNGSARWPCSSTCASAARRRSERSRSSPTGRSPSSAKSLRSSGHSWEAAARRRRAARARVRAPDRLRTGEERNVREHGKAISPHIPEGMLMKLDDNYIERYITFRGSPHGKDTYYGRHFFYRALNGQLYTLTVPPLGGSASSRTRRRLRGLPDAPQHVRTARRDGTRLYEKRRSPSRSRTSTPRTARRGRPGAEAPRGGASR